MKKKINNEIILACIIVLLCIVISCINPTFFTIANFLDMFRSITVTGMFAIAVLPVIISGGMDISFPSIAAFCMYSTVKIFNSIGYEGSIVLPIFVSAVIGFCLGSLNALLIHKFRLPTLIATIGTASLFSGVLLVFIGSAAIMNLPAGYTKFAKMLLITSDTAHGTSSVPIAFLVLIAIALIAHYVLRYTMTGRGIYAIGGNSVSAKRIGMNIAGIQLFIYGFIGAISGMAGTINTALKRTCNPFDVLGTELTIIAAVVLGGAKITGGRGTVIGTLLGVFMLTIISNSLIMIGISTYWQRAMIGILILVSAGITAYQDKNASAMLSIKK